MKRNRLQILLQFIRPYRWYAIGLVGLTACTSVLAMFPPLLIRGVIDQVITRGHHSQLLLFGLCMLAVPLLNAACSLLQVLTVSYVGEKVVLGVRCRLFDHLLGLSLRFYGKHSTGMLVNRLMSDSATVQSVVAVSTIQIVGDLACSAFALSVTFALNWRMAMLLLLIIVFFVVNFKMNVGRMRRASRGYRGAQDRLAGGIQNRLAGSLTVKTFGTEEREHEVFREQSDVTLDLIRENQYASNTFSMNVGLLSSVGYAMIYFIGCAMVLQGDLSYGDVVAFTAYAMQLLWPAVRFSYLAEQFQNVGISLDRLLELFEEQPEIQPRSGAVHLKRARGRVDFDHVQFHYEEDRPVLQDFDLHVPAGETVALVGPTGCGKTTLLSLLLRFFDVKRGAIKLDDIDIRDIDSGSLRRQFGIVLQESLLFDVSVAENIRYSRCNATIEEIRHAAQVAEIHDFIETLPKGYDSVMGGRGVQLSIGQKQRINIARAVLADPAILIMDEATSALDSESERAIQIAMNHFLKGRTSFIVAHRLSTIRNADRIVLLAKGRIEEMGRHDDLMAIPNGKYRTLYNRHAGKEILTDL